MGDYTVLIAILRMLELQEAAHLVLRRFITPPAHDTKARTGFAKPQGFGGRILATPPMYSPHTGLITSCQYGGHGRQAVLEGVRL